MDRTFFQENLDNPKALIDRIISEHTSNYDSDDYKLYDPANHDVMKKEKRPDKMIMKPSVNECNADGTPKMILATVLINRIAIPLQKLIVKRAAAFLTGGGVNLDSNPDGEVEEKLFEQIKAVWKKNKLNYKNNIIAKAVLSQTECAEIWYSRIESDKSVSMRCNIYTPADGYELFPVFDSNRDMIAFGMRYKSGTTTIFDIYTGTDLRRHTGTGGDWTLSKVNEKDEVIPLKYDGKIPVVYYSQEESAWKIVQPMIDRLEELISNFGDTNDYNGSPILFAKGNITGFAQKGEAGKMIEGDGPDVDLKYVTWEHAPESIKLEIETLLDFIYTCTQTPNISFKQMQGLGDVSGVMFDRILIDAHLAAMDSQQGYFGECIQRRLNFLIAACIAIDSSLKPAGDLEITPVFNLFKIDDVNERITNALLANGGKPVIDHESSVAMAGLTDDPKKTYDDIKTQQESDAAAALKLTQGNKGNNPKENQDQ